MLTEVLELEGRLGEHGLVTGRENHILQGWVGQSLEHRSAERFVSGELRLVSEALVPGHTAVVSVGSGCKMRRATSEKDRELGFSS